MPCLRSLVPLLAVAAVGCGSFTVAPHLILPADGPSPDRHPPVRPAAEDDPGGVFGTGDASGRSGNGAPTAATDPEPYVRARLDGKPARFDRPSGHWVVNDPVSMSPQMEYTLSAKAGELQLLLIVLGEYLPGPVEPPLDPRTEMKIVALADLPPGKPFRLDEPGVRIRLRSGETVERISLKPNTEYVAWIRIMTTGRSKETTPWPWPYLRFKTRG